MKKSTLHIFIDQKDMHYRLTLGPFVFLSFTIASMMNEKKNVTSNNNKQPPQHTDV